MEIIVNGMFPDDEQVLLESMSVTYIQQPDCCSDGDEIQELTIETRDGGGGKFFNIRTNEHGWSIEPDNNELDQLINDFKRRLNEHTDNSGCTR